MSIPVLRKSYELATEGKPFAVATVVRAEGSTSAKPGSKAIIDSDGKIVTGWVGGGCAESAVRHHARQSIQNGHPQLITLDMRDEILGVGMPCGGMMEVYIEPVLPKPGLLIIGHGAIAKALARFGALLNFSVTVNDPGANSQDFPEADHLLVGDLDLSGAAVGAQTSIVIATLHKSDHLWLQQALATDAAYIALISSRHRARLVLDYLVALGVGADQLVRVRAPAGLDLGADTPEEIALSVMSQIVALRRGGSGQSASSTESEEPVVIKQCDAGVDTPTQFPPSR